MQLTVRLPRWLATTLAIVVAAVAVAVVLPATAVERLLDHRLRRPGHEGPDLRSDLHRQHAHLEPAGGRGRRRGAAGAAGPAGPTGPAGPAVHLAKTQPTLTARIEASLEVQSATITDVNRDIRASSRSRTSSSPSTDPTIAELQDAVKVQGTSIGRLVNVLRALTKAQNQLLRGLE